VFGLYSLVFKHFPGDFKRNFPAKGDAPALDINAPVRECSLSSLAAAILAPLGGGAGSPAAVNVVAPTALYAGVVTSSTTPHANRTLPAHAAARPSCVVQSDSRLDSPMVRTSVATARAYAQRHGMQHSMYTCSSAKDKPGVVWSECERGCRGVLWLDTDVVVSETAPDAFEYTRRYFEDNPKAVMITGIGHHQLISDVRKAVNMDYAGWDSTGVFVAMCGHRNDIDHTTDATDAKNNDNTERSRTAQFFHTWIHLPHTMKADDQAALHHMTGPRSLWRDAVKYDSRVLGVHSADFKRPSAAGSGSFLTPERAGAGPSIDGGGMTLRNCVPWSSRDG